MRASPAVAVLSSLLTAFSPLSLLAQTARRVEPVEQKSGTVAAGDGSRWALVVGVDKYLSPEIPPLQGAVADAKAIAAALVRYAEFSPQQVITLTTDGAEKPTAAALIDKLAEVRSAVKPGDLLLFFFAGHGVEVEGRRFLLTHEAKATSPGALKMSALPVSGLMQELESIPVMHRIVMVDACRDDPISRDAKRPNVATAALEAAFTLQPSSEAGVRATFLSSTRGQSAYEWGEKGRGFFSYFIEKGLSGEAAVFGKVTVTSLAGYLNENVPQAVRQQRGKEQTPFNDLKGEALTLVRTEKLAVNPDAQRAPAAPTTRTVYGVVKDSNGLPLPGTLVRLAWAAGAARGAAGSVAAPQDMRMTADEDGFFKVEVPADAVVEISAQGPGLGLRSVSTSPAETGKKVSLFLPRTEAPLAAPPVAAPVSTPAPGPVAVAANVPPPAAGVPPVARPASAAGAPAAAVTPPAPALTTPAPKPAVAAPAAPPPAAKPAVPITPVPAPAEPAAVASSVPPAAPITPASTRPAPPAAAPVAPPATAPAATPPAVTASTMAASRPPVAAPAPTSPAPKPPASPVAIASASAPSSAPRPAPAAALPSLPTPSVQAQELAKVAYQTFLVEEFDDAQKAARSALDLDRDNGLAQAILANCLAVEGVNKSDAMKLATAKEMSQKLIQNNPTMALAHNALGLTLVGAKDMKGAQSEFASANALDPTLGIAGANLGYTFFQLKKLKDAERAYRAAIKARPESAVPYNGLAQVLLAQGDAGDAVKAARGAISRYELRDVYLASFYVNLAVALFQDGKRDQALEAVARAKSLGLEQNAAYELIEKAPANGKKKG